MVHFFFINWTRVLTILFACTPLPPTPSRQHLDACVRLAQALPFLFFSSYSFALIFWRSIEMGVRWMGATRIRAPAHPQACCASG